MLGQRISILRRRAGLSQAELARRLQISASAMGMYEQGRREPSVDTLVAIAEQLQVSTDFLMTGKIRTPQEDAHMIANLLGHLLSDEELAAFLAALLLRR